MNCNSGTRTFYWKLWVCPISWHVYWHQNMCIKVCCPPQFLKAVKNKKKSTCRPTLTKKKCVRTRILILFSLSLGLLYSITQSVNACMGFCPHSHWDMQHLFGGCQKRILIELVKYSTSIGKIGYASQSLKDIHVCWIDTFWQCQY